MLSLIFATETASYIGVTGEEIIDDRKKITVYFSDVLKDNLYDFLKATAETRNIDYHFIIQCRGALINDILPIMHRIRMLQRNGCHITTEVMVFAYSGGAFLWSMGDRRIVHQGDVLMFHETVYFRNDKLVPKSEWTEAMKARAKYSDKAIRDILVDQFGSKKIVDKLMNPRGNTGIAGNNSNYFNAEQIFNIGIAHDYYK
jgi:hypothetical protein